MPNGLSKPLQEVGQRDSGTWVRERGRRNGRKKVQAREAVKYSSWPPVCSAASMISKKAAGIAILLITDYKNLCTN